MKNIKEKCTDKFGRIDLRTILPKIKNIEELRDLVNTIEENFTIDDIKRAWSLSEEMPDDEVIKIKNKMKSFVNDFYDRLISLDGDKVITTSRVLEEYQILKTFILPLNHYVKYNLNRKYAGADEIIRYYSKSCPEFLEKFKSLLNEEHFKKSLENLKKKDNVNILLIRVIPGYEDEMGSIQIFPVNIFDAFKSNVYMPWGPYEFTEFCYNGKYDIVEKSLEEMEKEIDGYIEKFEIKSILDDIENTTE